MSLPNIWHLRKVADSSAKSCYVCYKPSTSVLITPDKKDFFYVCLSHLQDKGFCNPVVNAEEEAAKKKKEEMDREIEKVKREYEEKQRKKKEKKKAKEYTKDKDKDKDNEKKTDNDDDKQAEKEKDDKIKAIQSGGAESKEDDAPRIYALHKNFYQMRLDRIRNMELAKRNSERLRNPNTFPSAPKGDL